MVHFHNAKTDEDRNLYSELLSKINSKHSTLNVDQFRLIADWTHAAVLELIQVSDFKPCLKWMAKSLGDHITESMLQSVIERLIRLELIEQKEDGTFRRIPATFIDVKNKGKNTAIRKYHRQMITKALDAIDEQTNDERVLSGVTLAIDKSKIDEIRDLFDQFRRKVSSLSTPNSCNEVYQFNIQAFRLTKSQMERVGQNEI